MSNNAKDSELSDNVVDMYIMDNGESEESDFVYEVDTQNRFKAKQSGRGSEWTQIRRAKRKKVSSSGSMDNNEFDELSNGEKLTRLFETVIENKQMLTDISKEQSRYHSVTKGLQQDISLLNKRTEMTERSINNHAQLMKSLAYRSIDMEARSRRNNIIIWGVTERTNHSAENLVLCFLEDELDLDTSQIVIDRAHRMGPRSRSDHRSDNNANRADPKRPIIVRFRDYSDTEYILNRAYKLKGTPFGIDRDFPMEIANARKELYQSAIAKEARANRQSIQIRYPAKLFIEGRLVLDKFPEWQRSLREDRLNIISSEIIKQTNDDINMSTRGDRCDEYECQTVLDSSSESSTESVSVINPVQVKVNQESKHKQTNSTQSKGSENTTYTCENQPTRESRSHTKSVNIPIRESARNNSSDRRLSTNPRSETRVTQKNITSENSMSRVNKMPNSDTQQSKNRPRENPVNGNGTAANNDENTRL